MIERMITGGSWDFSQWIGHAETRIPVVSRPLISVGLRPVHRLKTVSQPVMTS